MSKTGIFAALLALSAFSSMGVSCESSSVLAVESYRTTLAGSNVVPSVTTSRTGNVTGTYASVINEFGLQVTHTIDPLKVTAITVRAGAAGASGGVLFDITPDPQRESFSATLRPEDMTAAGSITTFAQFVTELKAGRIYILVSTTDFPNGEVRGQLTRI
jgi:hypothetical protein